jgi:hypothetical protein
MRVTQSVEATGVSPAKSDVVALDNDLYIRSDAPMAPGVQPGKWSHVDGRRVRSLQALSFGGYDDLSGKLEMVGLLASIERTGPRELRGTVDLSKSTSFLPVPVSIYGDGARNAPWQARFDGPGRLTWLSVTISASGDVPSMTNEFTYSGIGEPVTVERPSVRDIVEAPESLYRIFGT